MQLRCPPPKHTQPAGACLPGAAHHKAPSLSRLARATRAAVLRGLHAAMRCARCFWPAAARALGRPRAAPSHCTQCHAGMLCVQPHLPECPARRSLLLERLGFKRSERRRDFGIKINKTFDDRLKSCPLWFSSGSALAAAPEAAQVTSPRASPASTPPSQRGTQERCALYRCLPLAPETPGTTPNFPPVSQATHTVPCMHLNPFNTSMDTAAPNHTVA
jgi:hypothetical protein